VARGSHFRSRLTSGAGRRRKVSWSPSPSGQITGISISSSNLLGTNQQALLDDLTLVRTRGSLLVKLAADANVEEGFIWAFGLCNVTENAAGIGVTAVPAPLTDIAWDGWFVHETGQCLQTTEVYDVADPGISQRVQIDSKAMRKTHATDVIVGVFETLVVGTPSTLSMSFVGRMLDKLA